jgi:hypothetical protein
VRNEQMRLVPLPPGQRLQREQIVALSLAQN